MTATKITLPPLRHSPTILQYSQPKPSAKSRPLYERRFIPNAEAQATLSQPWLTHTDPAMPLYPYAARAQSDSHFFSESAQGLYGGATIQSGNKISKGRNKGKTLRKWYPNVRVEKLRSEALGVEMSIPTTARVMRTINKCGGLDQYLLGEKPARIKELGLLGWKLRWLVLRAPSTRGKFEMQRKQMGLEPELDTFEDAWADPEVRSEILQKTEDEWRKLREKDEKFTRHVKQHLGWKESIKEMRTLHIDGPEARVGDVSVSEEKDQEALDRLKVPKGWGLQELKAPAANDGRQQVTV